MRKLEDMSDDEIVAEVLSNNQEAVVYVFYDRYLPVFQYHIGKLYQQGGIRGEIRDFVDEFFLYLCENDWRRLRTYDSSKASLATWMSVSSFRFFRNYKHSKIDSGGLISINDKWETFVGDWVHSHDAGMMMDLRAAVDSISNERDREIARLIFIEDADPQKVAPMYGLSVVYVYTVKSRIVRKLKNTLL